MQSVGEETAGQDPAGQGSGQPNGSGMAQDAPIPAKTAKAPKVGGGSGFGIRRRLRAWRASLLRQALLIGLVLACLLPELLLQGADHRLWGAPGWRRIFYEDGAFWPGLLQNWRENWPGQRWGMFLTYGFLHAGLVHLLTNMLTLISLGAPLIARLGALRFSFVYAAALFGGALGYAFLADALTPMVGASGALFGLAGGVIERDQAEMRAEGWSHRDRLTALARPVGVLIMLNVVMYWAMHGQLAWQTHLGGFLGGVVTTWVLGRR